jgi:hypothetical protein
MSKGGVARSRSTTVVDRGAGESWATAICEEEQLMLGKSCSLQTWVFGLLFLQDGIFQVSSLFGNSKAARLWLNL